MSDADKHRARIFLHRGQLAQAKDAYEQAVTDDRLAHDQARFPSRSAIWATSVRYRVIWIEQKPVTGKYSRSSGLNRISRPLPIRW